MLRFLAVPVTLLVFGLPFPGKKVLLFVPLEHGKWGKKYKLEKIPLF